MELKLYAVLVQMINIPSWIVLNQFYVLIHSFFSRASEMVFFLSKRLIFVKGLSERLTYPGADINPLA